MQPGTSPPSPPVQLGSAKVAQLSIWSAKNSAFGQPGARQLATHDWLNDGGTPLRSMHMNEHETNSRQPMTWHPPQSCGQLAQVSKGPSHWLLPQMAHGPQSD